MRPFRDLRRAAGAVEDSAADARAVLPLVACAAVAVTVLAATALIVACVVLARYPHA